MKIFLPIVLLAYSLESFAVPEYPDPRIPDIAVTTFVNGQIAIVYNPSYCNMLGPYVCNFFRAHEYGHINLNHVINRTFPTQAEYEADCWAARNAPLSEVQAAYQHFMNQGFMGNWSHGTGIQRAQRIAQCAQYRSGW